MLYLNLQLLAVIQDFHCPLTHLLSWMSDALPASIPLLLLPSQLINVFIRGLSVRGHVHHISDLAPHLLWRLRIVEQDPASH